MGAQAMNGEIGGKELGQLQVALNPRAVAPYLEDAYSGLLGRNRCQIVDVKYEPSRRCTILYDVGGRLVLGTLGWGEPLTAPSDRARSIDPLEMQTYLFPDDPALSGLATVFDPEGMRQVLTTALPACRAGEMRILRSRTTLLRYRPARRCTVRVDLWLVDQRSGEIVQHVLYGKVYHDLAKATAVFADMRVLASTAALRDQGVAVARPVAFVPELAMILQEPLAGAPLEALLGRRAGVVARVAEALAALHGTRLQAMRRRPIAPALRRMAERAAAISLVDERLGRRISELAEALLADGAALADLGARARFVHGDCKPSQFLLGSHVAMLDFDHAGMADPACDIGDFMATLRQLSVREAVRARRAPSADRRLQAVEECFLASYGERHGSDPDLSTRVAWYQALALLRKAIRRFQRSPSSPLPALLVDESWRCLESWSTVTSTNVSVAIAEQGGRRS